MLGYNTFRYKLLALVLSGRARGAAGAAYALLFAYVGSTFASIQYSIYAAAVDAARRRRDGRSGRSSARFLMFYLVDIASEIHLRLPARGRRRARRCSSCSFRSGILGTVRESACRGCRDALETRGLTRISAACTAVDDVDFALAAGEIARSSDRTGPARRPSSV